MRAARLILVLIVIALVAVSTVGAQQNNKPLTNQDVMSMVKNVLPESVIIDAIKTNDTDFDVSANGLIALKKAAVTSKVMEAMLAAANNKKNAAAAPAPPASVAATGIPNAAVAANSGAGTSASTPVTAPANASPAWQPTVSAVQGATKVSLTAEPTQIVQTKSKPTSLATLAADQTLNQALQIGTQAAQQAAQQALMKNSSAMALSTLVPGASLMSGIMNARAKQAKVTYVWALSGGNSAATSVAGSAPTFVVNYGGIPGVNPEQFEPVIVKLTPTPQSNFRLVGATEASTTAEQSTQQDWPIYSSFVEDRVAAKVEKVSPGHAQVTASSGIAPGEYAVAFRPVDKSKKFAGDDVGRNQGEGLLFNYAWSFSVK
jgi:hypothetical protein